MLLGGAERDLINGGFGGDIMAGGAGADTFEFATIREVGVSTRDSIRDFSHADGDKIDLSRIDAHTRADGDQVFTFVDGSVAPDAITGGTVTVTASTLPGAYIVTIDIDGDGRDGQFFVNSPGATLTAQDFIL